MTNKIKFLEVESTLGNKYIVPIDSIFCVFEDNESKVVELFLKNTNSEEIKIECKTPYNIIRDFLFET
jgi:hypothetical protein